MTRQSSDQNVADDELMTELRKRTQESLYAGGCFKGLPGDKPYEEMDIAGIVLKHLGKIGAMKSEPCGPDTAPDVGIELQSGKHIGLEVTELVDGALRGQHAARRRAEQANRLSENDIFDSIIRTGVDPLPAGKATVAFGIYRACDAMEIAAKLDCIMRRKDTNTHLLKYAPNFDTIWLAVFTGEQHVNDFPCLVRRSIDHLRYHPTLISRVFVVLDYMPGCDNSGYPVIEVSSPHL